MENLPIFGSSLVAKEAIVKDELILQISEDLFITVSSIKNNQFIKTQILDKNRFQEFQPRALLALYIYLESNFTENFQWKDYIESIPKQYDNIVTWTVEDLEFLERQEIIDKFQIKLDKNQKQFEKISEILPEVYKNQQWNLQNFSEIIAMTESRTLFYKNQYDPISDVGALVPFYDYCNHTFEHDNPDIYSSFYYDEKEKQFVMKASKNYEKGDQIFISYGTYPNIHFLEYYGFFLENNPFEILSFGVESQRKFQDMFGQQILIQLEKYSEIGKSLLPHMFAISSSQSGLQLNFSQLKIEVEYCHQENKAQFVWQIQQLLKILSLKIEINNNNQQQQVKNQNFKKIQKSNGKLKQKNNNNSNKQQQQSIVQQIILRFEDEQFQEQNIDFGLYEEYLQNFKQYCMNNLYKQRQEIPQNSKQKLAQSYAQHERNVINQLQP